MRWWRSPLGIAVLFSVALASWLFSRPIEVLLAVDKAAPRAPSAAASVAPSTPRMTVRVVESVARKVAPELIVKGHTEPVRVVQLKAETSGRVVETPVAEGATVEADTLIAQLDLRNRKSRLREQEANVAQRRLEYEAARKLGAKQFQSETRVAEALAQLEAARAQLDEARLDLEHVTIEAPFKGVVERRMVEAGDFVEPGDPVAEVIEQDPFLVVGDAPEMTVVRFELGEPGVAVLADGRTVLGHIRYVATMADAETRTFRIELEVPNPDGRIPAGMSARVVVREPEQMAHRVSAASLVLADDGEIGIKAVDADGIVRFYPARIAKAETDAVWLAGLPERLQVITTGQGFVAAGEKVGIEIVPAEPEAVAITGKVPA